MKQATKQPAMVSGAQIISYGILRSLGRQGVSVAALRWSGEPLIQFSRYCRKAYRLSGTETNGEICALLLAWADQFDGKPVIFPGSDRFTLFLANYQEELSKRYEFHWQPAQTVSLTLDKSKLSDFCVEQGILIPATHSTQPGEDLAKSAKGFRFPLLVKPKRRFGTRFPRGKAFLAESPSELLAFYKANLGLQNDTIWQEVIQGDDSSVFQCTVLARRPGEVALSCPVRKLRQSPPGYGSMCYGRTEPNEWVTAESARMVRLLGYRGIASFEFKRCIHTGRYFFIEVNPRFPWYCGLFTDAGVNLPYLAYLDLVGAYDRAAFETQPRHGLYWASAAHDLRAYFQAAKTERQSLWRRLQSLARVKSRAWWASDDPKAFLAACLYYVGVLFRRITGKQHR